MYMNYSYEGRVVYMVFSRLYIDRVAVVPYFGDFVYAITYFLLRFMEDVVYAKAGICRSLVPYYEYSKYDYLRRFSLK